MKDKKVWLLVLALGVLYWAVLILGPVAIRALFEQGRIDQLNSLTANQGSATLDFYLGRSQETVLGPIAQIMGGLILILLVTGPLRGISAGWFFVSFFVFLFFTKFNVLFFPPYGDAVGGPFAEGLWLAQNNFDYAGLARQPDYSLGGPRVYFFSFFPSYLALLMKLTGSVKIFLVLNHLVFFALAAATVTFVREMARKVFYPEIAGLLAALVLLWPVFQTQTEIVNMEMPSLFFAALSAYALTTRRIHLSGTAALLSLFAKGSGAFACAAFLFCGAVEFFGEKSPARRRNWIYWCAGLVCAAVFVVAAKFVMKDQHVAAGLLNVFAGWPSLKTFKITYFFLAQLAFMGFLAFFQYRRSEAPGIAEDSRRESWRTVFIVTIFAAMWFLLFLNFMNVSPRYRAAVYPFLLFGIVWAIGQVVRWRLIQVAGLAVAILIVQWNSFGLHGRVMRISDYVLLEENLQYRNDLEVTRRLAARVEDRYNGAAIAAPMVVAQALAIPQMGYVKDKRNLFIYGFNCTYGNIIPFPGLGRIDPMRVLYVTLTQDTDGPLPYPIHPNDRIVDTIEWGNKKAWIFMGGFSIEMRRQIMLRMIQQKERQ